MKTEGIEHTVPRQQDLCTHQCESLASRRSCGEGNWEKNPAAVSAVPDGRSQPGARTQDFPKVSWEDQGAQKFQPHWVLVA